MKKIVIISALIVIVSNLFAQGSVDSVLIEIEENNKSLVAMRKSSDAERIGNKTGIYLQNPEMEFNYLWGSPSAIGNRTDFSIKQTFDFPTAYSFKNQVSKLKNEQLDLEYQKKLKEIQFESRLICFDLIYINAMMSALNYRYEHAKSIAQAYQSKFDTGETSLLEYNKSQLNLLNVKSKLASIEIERNMLLADLARMNGGNPINFTDSVFHAVMLPDDLEQWYVEAEQFNPMLAWIKKEIEISQKLVGLNNAMNLPKLQAGYMSETVAGEKFQGLSVGLSIPLWENKNTVKFEKANTLALISMETDNKFQFYAQLKALHAKTISMHKSTAQYRTGLLLFNNEVLLKKALEQGELSLIDYMLELSFYYVSVDLLLEMEKKMFKAYAELQQYY